MAVPPVLPAPVAPPTQVAPPPPLLPPPTWPAAPAQPAPPYATQQRQPLYVPPQEQPVYYVPAKNYRPKQPRKWIGPAGGWLIAALFFVLWLIHLIFNELVTHSTVLSPNTLILGGFMMAAAFLYTMAYRLRPTDGVTPLRLILAFLFGGLFATELAFWPELGLSFIRLGFGGDPTIVLTSLVGFIEEGCKLFAVLIASRGLKVRNARTGLFMGGAVGFGFAAFEDMRYAWESIAAAPHASDQFWAVIQITLSRNVIGVFEHPILSAMIASAVFAAANNGRFRATPRVVGVFVIFAVVHSLIDTLPYFVSSAAGNGVGGDLLSELPDVVIALGLGVVWLVYSRRVNRRMFADGLEPPAAPIPEPAPTS